MKSLLNLLKVLKKRFSEKLSFKTIKKITKFFNLCPGVPLAKKIVFPKTIANLRKKKQSMLLIIRFAYEIKTPLFSMNFAQKESLTILSFHSTYAANPHWFVHPSVGTISDLAVNVSIASSREKKYKLAEFAIFFFEK